MVINPEAKSRRSTPALSLFGSRCILKRSREIIAASLKLIIMLIKSEAVPNEITRPRVWCNILMRQLMASSTKEPIKPFH